MLRLTQCSLILVVLTSTLGDVYNESSTTAPIHNQSYGLLKEHNARDYCISQVNFYCIATQRSICVRAGMCITEVDTSSSELTAAVGGCPYFPHESSWCSTPSLHGYYEIPMTMSLSEITNFTCNYYNQQGLMCSQC